MVAARVRKNGSFPESRTIRKLSHVFRAPFVELGRNLHRSVPITRSVLNGAIWSVAERGQIGQVIERNGRHEETRTPDLYRVNSLADVKPDNTERDAEIPRGSTGAALPARHSLARPPEEYPPTQPDTDRDGRVTTQTTTQMYKEQNYRKGRGPKNGA